MKRLAFCYVLLFMLILCGCGDPEAINSPQECFQSVFQQAPPPSIRNLKGEGTEYKSAVIFLRFQVSKPVFLKLIGTRVHFISRKAFVDGGASVGPEWWDPLAGNPTIFATTSRTLRDPSYSQGFAYVAYAPANQIAYVYSNAWD